jgi:hypothetical protein
MRTALAVLGLAAAVTPAVADDAISWEEAAKHVGEEATVEGRVVDVHCSPLSCLLAFEPSFNRFTAVIQAQSFDAMPPADLERRYVGKDVRVHGRIEDRDGKPEIVVDRPDAITLAGARRSRDKEGSRADARAETMERLTEVLARVEELTERLADVEQRMDALLARLEQREAALAAAQPPAPPPPPSYGEPQQRPAFEALRTVKRGMSRAEVERLVGQPQYVENGGNGWTTWYYGYGRSVSFDARGRAQALVGFPAP